MTEILIVVTDQKLKLNQKSLKIQKIQHILQACQMSCAKIDDQNLQFLLPFSLLKPSKQLSKFYDYFLLGTLSYCNNTLSISSLIFKQSGIQVKASSLHQKTFLIRYLMSINQKDKCLQVKVHPITGQIKLISSFIVSNSTEIQNIVYQILSNFKYNDQIILKILNSIEDQTLIPENNEIFKPIYEKIQPLRTILTNTSQPDIKVSMQQKEHKKLFFGAESQSLKPKKCSENFIERMKKCYVQQFLDRFIFNSSKIRIHNFMYYAFQNTAIVQKLLKSIQNDQPLIKRTQKFKLDGENRQINCQIKYLGKEAANFQYCIADKFQKKKMFVTFLKQYVIARNYLQISNNYLMTKSVAQTQSLYTFVQKNKLILSFETKLKIVSQILTIALICLQKIDKFQPNLMLNNLIVDKNFVFKLESLSRVNLGLQNNLIQIMYKLFYQKSYFWKKGKTGRDLKTNNFISIQNTTFRYWGPSIVMKIILKMLQNFQESVNSGNKSTTNLANFLLVINRVLDTYQKVIKGLEEDKWFSIWR